MAGTLQALVTGGALSAQARRELGSWLRGCKTGDDRLRAGVPAHWRVGDKTGSGANGTTNDIAVLSPPGRAPIFVSAYYTGSSATEEARARVLAQVGKLVAAAFW